MAEIVDFAEAAAARRGRRPEPAPAPAPRTRPFMPGDTVMLLETSYLAEVLEIVGGRLYLRLRSFPALETFAAPRDVRLVLPAGTIPRDWPGPAGGGAA